MIRQVGLGAIFCAAAQFWTAQAQSTHPGASARAHSAPSAQLPAVPLPTEAGTYAVIYTSMGNLVCRLLLAKKNKTVANFKELATGAKLWTDPASGRPQR